MNDPVELLNLIVEKRYEPPLSIMMDELSGKIPQTPIINVLLLIDFDTERLMNGILNFLGNFTGAFAHETAAAFAAIGATNNHAALTKVLAITDAAGMDHASIRRDMENGSVGQITSWHEQHGDKWAAAEEAIIALDDDFDQDEFAEKIEAYVAAHYEGLSAWVR